MKRLGIYTGQYFDHWDDTSVENGIGGSETWAYEVSKYLSHHGFEVTLYADPSEVRVINRNFRIVPWELLNADIRNHKVFDYFIYSRITDIINPYLKCENVYVMLHDVTGLHYKWNIGLGRVKKYGYLSEWHKQNLLDYYSDLGLTEDQLFKVSNGCSRELYNQIVEKTNSIVWSSSLVRGLFPLYEQVFYDIMQQVPDFKIYVCCGTTFDKDLELLEKAKLLPGVEVLTKLPKEELAALQCQAKVWVYPGTFEETFCITAVENGMAGNAIICPPTYGLATTLKDYVGFCNAPDHPFVKEDADWYRQETIKCLTDDKYRIMKAASARYICSQYSWERAAEEWIAEFSKSDIMTNNYG